MKNFFGPSALERFQWDVCAFGGIKYMVVCLGKNESIQPGTLDAPKTDRIIAQNARNGRESGAARTRARHDRPRGHADSPCGGSMDCSSEKDKIRVEINWRMMRERLFDDIVDFDAAFAREGDPDHAMGYTGKDGGPPGPLGGQALAQRVPLEWFAQKENPIGRRRPAI